MSTESTGAAGGQNAPERPGERPVSNATETTSIHLPPLVESGLAVKLSAEESAAVEALPAGSAILIAHLGPNQGARFLLDDELIKAGRHPEADIFLDDVTVSRRHVEFRRENGGYRVVDAGSLNGTYLNGDRVDAASLHSGDEVRIGKFRLTYYARSAA
ncbi:FHA domain-containing protein [Psychromicrobium xiongbiense]|uniref:FHA domain-containing protein n=1 Tax=Psychromicrobium xiongbiense TaxID=3051184 RepID=UPI0025543C61|nr:FHA domain-containing protein [Psychromicrobium sp. YIM S02556]